MILSLLVTLVAMTLLGVLAAAPVITAKRPNAAPKIDRIVPHQNLIGVAGFIIGIIFLLDTLGSLDAASIVPITITLYFVSSILLILLGFLLGYEKLDQYLFARNLKISVKAAQAKNALIPYTQKMGVAILATAALLLFISVFRVVI